MLGVGVLIGFRPDATPLEWVAAAGMLALFVVALSWFAALIGLLAKTPEGASGFTFFVMFLPYPSSAFVPIATMPAWIDGFAAHQPVTPVIETIRSLLLGTPAGTNPARRWRGAARSSSRRSPSRACCSGGGRPRGGGQARRRRLLHAVEREGEERLGRRRLSARRAPHDG